MPEMVSQSARPVNQPPSFIYVERERGLYGASLNFDGLERFSLSPIKGKMQGSNYQVDKEPLMQIPLVQPSPEKKAAIISLVDEIMSCIGRIQELSIQLQQNYTKQIADCVEMRQAVLREAFEGRL